MTSSLIVYWGQKLVGRLRVDGKRNYSFQYAPEWLSAGGALQISVSLPLRAEPFEGDVARNFFSNLLPEALIRTLIAKKIGISEGNDFQLLEELGGECAGALALIPEGQILKSDGGYQPLSREDLDKKIEEMPRQPLLTATEGLRLSLAGAQNKLPVFLKNDAIFLPLGASASSHILKPKIPEFDDTVENEAFCMTLAKGCGLPVPAVKIRDGKHAALLVSRYDRVSESGTLTRLHQEDFCQALGFSHEQKYQKDGGPGLKQCLDLLAESSSNPLLDKSNLLRWIVFNYLIGNGDAHAKNISILIDAEGVRLAPFYDLMSTVIYKGLSKELAMRIGREDRPDWIFKRHWMRLAEDAAVAPKAVTEICFELADTLPNAALKLSENFIARHGAKTTITAITAHSAAMAKRLIEGFEHEKKAAARKADD